MTADVTRPAVFVGSSSEGLAFARAVRAALEEDAEITVWNEGVFEVGETLVESLMGALSRFDFAVVVLTPDDLVQSRAADTFGPRDNVIFELGLFMGRLGRDRTFILHQSHSSLKIPSDLSGVAMAQYHWPRADNNYRGAVAAACDKIRDQIRTRGALSRSEDSRIGSGLDLTRVKEAGGAMWTTVGGCEIRVANGRIEECPIESKTVVVLPCNEYFDDECARDTRSALGAYVNKMFAGRVDEFISLSVDECRRRLGPGNEQQKTADQRGLSFGAGHAILLKNPLGRTNSLALISTTTQRAGQGLSARTSYLFNGVAELVTRLVDARIHEITMPILGAGHGRIEPSLAFVSLILAVAEAARCAPGGQPLKRVTIVVFRQDAESTAQVDPVVVRRALALVGSPV
jgi:CAP12/Pycsar effector protein, TIR domain